ncbi:MAG: hypothetical protein J6V44_17600 [Methanobrevibacter sp.]|nr:hypothetical protein [Methanobrevibacter sp.]
MKINEGYMSEINLLVNDYKEFCETHGREPNLQKCFAYVKANLGEEVSDRDLFPIVKDMFIEEIEGSDLAEAMKVCESFGYRILKEAEDEDVAEETEDDPLDGESDEIKTMVRELAEYTGNDYSDAEVEYNEGPGQLAVQVTFGNEEYYCYESYDDAETAAQEDSKELFDDIGIEGIRFENIGGIEQFVDSSWFEDAKKEDAEYYVSDIHESEPERYQKEFGDVDEDEAVEKYLENYYENDDVQWYIDNFGKKQFTEIVKKNNLINLDKLAEAIVDADGPANSLARYDGDEISLDCGYYCYRTN